MTRTLRIATRQSPLALWQAHYVRDRLLVLHPELKIELLGMTTKGDRILDAPLAKVGGKGLFVKELEQAMLEGRADLAVHSMKDVPMELPEGLAIVCICEREDPRDALVSPGFATISALPQGAVVGTSSLRRQCQLRALRPDLQLRDLRGNVGSRLAKLDAGDYDAIILASAGLKRLELGHRIRDAVATEALLPAVGQGAVGIECRSNDAELIGLLQALNHEATQLCVTAERAMNRHLQGGCQVPIAGYATFAGDTLQLRALVGSVDGTTLLRAEGRQYFSLGNADSSASQLGIRMAEDLLAAGAAAILASVYDAP